MDTLDEERIAAVYRNLFQQHGASPQGLRWDNEFQQLLRLKILLGIADISNTKILDFGCGYGPLIDYLKQQNINVDYTGIDIVDEFLVFGRATHPDCRFCQQQDIENETFDYIFLSGMFTAVRDNNRKFWQDTIRWCFSRANKGIAFNMWSIYADKHIPERYYEDPGEVFRFVKQELDFSCGITIRNDYITKQDCFSSHDFTVYLHK